LREEDECPGLIWAFGNLVKAPCIRIGATWRPEESGTTPHPATTRSSPPSGST